MGKNSKGILTFIIGAAVGSAITYLFTSKDGKELLNKAREKGKDIKNDLQDEIEKGKSLLSELKNFLNTSESTKNGNG